MAINPAIIPPNADIVTMPLIISPIFNLEIIFSLVSSANVLKNIDKVLISFVLLIDSLASFT